MARLLAYPVRLGSNGTFVDVEDGEDYYAQEIACLIQTQPGERELVPDYGIDDPTFSEFDRLELASKIEAFGPPVDIQDVIIQVVNDQVISVEVKYEPVPRDDDDFDDGDGILEPDDPNADYYNYNGLADATDQE